MSFVLFSSKEKCYWCTQNYLYVWYYNH